MTLFGALTSGVSGLTAQSSAMGAISDNITNVNTIGYKGTKVNFQTLVTVQTSTTFYSAGGVQSKPRQDTGVQGLLQSSTSQTDLAISGNGFFVVNEAAQPTLSNEFLFTRAGSFFQDDEGYLRNTAGYYLQAWPTTADGTVTTNNTSLTIPNQNVLSTDFLATVNLNRVGGTATATSEIGIGANLPTTDSEGTTHKTDVQFFDSLGNANTTSFVYTKTNRDNQWDVELTPPPGVNVATLYADTSGSDVYESRGVLQFIGLPADDSTVTITQTVATGSQTITYQFDRSGTATDTTLIKQVNVSSATTIAQYVAALETKIKGSDSNFADHGGFTNTRVDVAPGDSTTLYFTDDGTSAITVNPTGLLTSAGARASTQESSYTVQKKGLEYRDFQQFTFGTSAFTTAFLNTLGAASATMTINGVTYTLSTTEATAGGFDNDTTIRVDSLANFLSDLEGSIEANDPSFATGASSIRLRNVHDVATSLSSTAYDTLILSTLSSGSYNVTFSSDFGTTMPTEPDGTVSYTSGTANAYSVDKSNAIKFDSDGLPSEFNVSELELSGFANGAANMDDDASNSPRITVDFGTVNEADGFTQFGAEFTPGFITQNGSQFGTLAGITVDNDGLMTALFDNGETRPIFKLPVATFVNVNGLGARSGNVWNQTQASGDNTLREANNGVAGAIEQAALESSTVDIGEEFTKMIVVQRAYSASTRIISTADEMLEELVRIKR